MYELRKFIAVSSLRPFLVIGAGVILSLLFFKFALTDRLSTELRQPVKNSLPNTGKPADPDKNEFAQLPTLGFQAVAQAPASQGSNCTYTSEYWRDHPEVWATDNIIIGQFSFSKIEGQAVLSAETEDTATLLHQQFLAAVLNILKGADAAPVEGALNEASQWIDKHPPKVELPEVERSRGSELTRTLADYNHGVSGPRLCPDQPATSTPTPTHTPTATPTPTTEKMLPVTITKAIPILDPDERSEPTEQDQATDEPIRTSIPTQAPAATQAPPSTPTNAPTTAPTAPSTPPADSPPSPAPEPTNPPTDGPPSPSQVPPPTPAPAQTEPPPPAPTEESKHDKEPKPTKEPKPADYPKP